MKTFFMQRRTSSFSSMLSLMLMALIVSSCHPYVDDILESIGREKGEKPEEVIITQSTLFPEGIAYDQHTHRFLVSSLTRGTIGAVDDQGNYESFIEDEDFASTIGIEIDHERQRLLVCVSDPNTATVAALGSYDLTTGERQFYTDLVAVTDETAPHFANDVAVDHHGNAYVTDSYSPIIYKVDAHGEASIFLQDETFQASPEAFGLNGIVFNPNEFLTVAFSETATLYKVPLDNPESFTPIVTEEGAITSPDGLYLAESADVLVVVNNDGGGEQGNVVALSSDDQWKTGHLQHEFATGPVFPTTVAQRGHDFYVLYAHLNELFAGNSSRDTFEITRVDFKEEEEDK